MKQGRTQLQRHGIGTVRRVTLAVMALALGILNSEPTHLAAQTGGPTVRFRVNAGGPVVSSTPNWSADTAAAPSPFVNAAATD